MRVRTTWNNDDIAKRASMPKQADPYLMNQDHVKVQPPADKYVIGDPSTFAEDVHPNDWSVEYSGGQTKRDEIGMPAFRPETFNHPEKTAALNEGLLVKKADLCTTVARMMLGSAAVEAAVEDQALSFMYLPDAALIETHARLAQQQNENPFAKKEEKGEQQQEKQAQDQQQVEQVQTQDKQAQDQQQQQVQEKQAQDQQQVQQVQEKQAQDQQQVQEQVMQDKQSFAIKAQTAMAAGDMAGFQAALKSMVAEAVAQTKLANATPIAAADVQAMLSAAVQEAVGGQQQVVQQQPQVQQQQVAMGHPMQQQAELSDDAMLAEMLGGPVQAPMGMNESDIILEPSPMDVGEVVLAAEDDVLKTLFATAESDAQQAQEDAANGVDKQAHVLRTASSRTVGTRPTAGVAKMGGAVGGGAAAATDINKLSALWVSAPDVRDAFGIAK